MIKKPNNPNLNRREFVKVVTTFLGTVIAAVVGIVLGCFGAGLFISDDNQQELEQAAADSLAWQTTNVEVGDTRTICSGGNNLWDCQLFGANDWFDNMSVFRQYSNDENISIGQYYTRLFETVDDEMLCLDDVDWLPDDKM